MQHGRLVTFFNKQFTPKLQRASKYVQELHAMTTAIRKWRQYLLGHKFTILTDYRNLKELMTQIIQTPEQQYYLAKLLGYNYTIQFKSGHSNVIADSLSRIEVPFEPTFLVLSVPQIEFMDQLRATLQASPIFQHNLSSISSNPELFRISRCKVVCFYTRATYGSMMTIHFALYC